MVWDWLKRAWGGIKPILTRYVKPILTKVDEYASYIPEYSAIRDTVAKTGRQVLDVLPDVIKQPIGEYIQEVGGSYLPDKFISELNPVRKKIKTEEYEKPMSN